MSNTANLVLPFLAVGQAQKHVTVNESLRKLDAIVQLSVVSATTTAEPGSPSDGAVYIIPSGKTGTSWTTFANWSLGYYRDGVWVEITPREGWLAFVRDTDRLLYYTGSAWGQTPLTVSATDKVLGRVSSGGGAVEEVTFTDQAQQLCDDASFPAMRTTLGAAGLADANTFTNDNVFNVSVGGGKALIFENGGGAGYRPFFTADHSSPHDILYINLAGGAGGWSGRMKVRGSASGGALSDIIDVNVNGGAPITSFACPVLPAADDTHDLGSASFRWDDVYATNGTIQTSDARDKTAIQPLPESVKRAIRRIMGNAGVFQWRASVAAKAGDARLHVGVTAQDVRDAFLAEGEDPERWGVFCADPLVELAEVTERVRQRRQVIEMEERETVEIVDGKPILTRVSVQKPVTWLEDVVDGDGSPVVRDGKTLRHAVPVYEDVEVEVTRIEPVAVKDEAGAQVMRLGVRYDQLFAMALAALFEDQAAVT